MNYEKNLSDKAAMQIQNYTALEYNELKFAISLIIAYLLTVLRFIKN